MMARTLIGWRDLLSAHQKQNPSGRGAKRFVSFVQPTSQTFISHSIKCECFVKVFNSSVENFVEKPSGKSEGPAIAKAYS
jgi:hypothetical protein